jgi:chaperonin GroEL (HSP60 family)
MLVASLLWFQIIVVFVVQAVADIIRTTLGPRSMLKMLLDAGGGLFLNTSSFF